MSTLMSAAIRPHHIMITSQGHAKLAGFGRTIDRDDDDEDNEGSTENSDGKLFLVTLVSLLRFGYLNPDVSGSKAVFGCSRSQGVI